MPAGAATFEPGECPKTNDSVAALARARCGWLTVPENRTKADSRPIRLPVVILAARARQGADPIVYMEGGPGGPVLPSADVMVAANINATRDVIMLGQRGSLYARPSPDLPRGGRY